VLPETKGGSEWGRVRCSGELGDCCRLTNVAMGVPWIAGLTIACDVCLDWQRRAGD